MSANREGTERKAPKTAFKPGQSGNPKGRPKQTQEQKDALEQIRAMAPEAVAQLRKMINDPKTRADARIRAIEIVLERTYGKAVAAVSITSGSFDALEDAFNALKGDDAE